MILGKHRCPICGNTNFIVSAHVVQTWKVDEDGDFIEEVTSCDEVTHSPDNYDIWTCTNQSCTWSGAGSDALIQ